MSSQGQDVDHSDLVTKFREVTGVDEERAKFYLEAAGWQLQTAMGGFFEEELLDPQNVAEDSEPEDTRLTATTTGPPMAKPHQPARATGGLMTLDALRNAAETDSSDDDDKQAFYAGGSQSSGQQVLGPPKNRDEIIADMFKKAREHGAEEVSPQMLKKKGGGGTFGGVGYKLGESGNEPSQTVGVPSSSSASAGSGVRDIVLRLWSTGFTVGDGPLRNYKDPANQEFFESVKRGEVPLELRREYSGQEVSMRLEDRRGEEYAPPKIAARPFAGKGQMLGSPTPVTVGSTVPSSENDRKANESVARSQIQLTAGEPTTTIQLRLVDGSRLAVQFNHTHTVDDLHAFINTARPEYSTANYVLTLFPSTELTEKTKSLKEANVLNSALVQKIKH